MTVFLTVLSGVLVFVFGRIIETFLLKPISDQRVILQDISRAMTYHAYVFSNPGVASKERNDQAHEELRILSADLRAKTYALPIYKHFVKIGWVKDIVDINTIANNLIGLSNGVYDAKYVERNHKGAEEIEELLEK